MSDKVQCPVCCCHFSSKVVTEHVNVCLNNKELLAVGKKIQVKEDIIENKKRKISDWDFLTSKAKKIGGQQKVAVPVPVASQQQNADTDTIVVENLISSRTTEMSAEIKIDVDQEPEEKNHKQNKFKSTFGQKTKVKELTNVPLAERMRPQDFDRFIGQEQAVGAKSLIQNLLAHGDSIPSMILWGPPGCGKTTLANIVAQKCKSNGNIKYVSMSATSASVNDVKETAKVARNDLKMLRRKTVLFLDEIHRFNKLQQDALLPHIEEGTIILIGATTENPSFQVNAALLSRCRVIKLEKLAIDDIKTIIKWALSETGIHVNISKENSDSFNHTDVGSTSNNRVPLILMDVEAIDALAALVDGDARVALNGLQLAIEGTLAKDKRKEQNSPVLITVDVIKEALQRSHILYDKTGEEHYNTVSALIKSMRGSDASAALYWMARMIEGGENPLFIARRLVIFASEDVGLADPMALSQAVATHQACHVIGMPECALNLAHCVIYLSRAPKSVEVLQAFQAAQACVRNHEGALPPVPLHLRNTSNKLIKSLGIGKDKYPPVFAANIDQCYFPPSLMGTNFFTKPPKT
ncbi:unnamed protein product [Lymnaea stagnalis]|uniref:UBZ4-type domain-containing protein n=1 Tax=Lymnaea stagnalis TaxID=6523 RepID=A0AAV2HEW8_LYMST